MKIPLNKEKPPFQSIDVSDCRTFLIRNPVRTIPGILIGTGQPHLITIVGATSSSQLLSEEIDKVHLAEKFGISIIADVSTTDEIAKIHKTIINETNLPLSTVPIYEIYREARRVNEWNNRLSRSLVLETIEAQAARGVDCMTIHTSHNQKLLPTVQTSSRRVKVQGRGGGMIHEFMLLTGRENPLYEWYEDILAILAKYKVVLSLGNCLRAGTVDDPIDELVELEVANWSSLTNQARNEGVAVMVEGGSHLRMQVIKPYVHWVSKSCYGAPLRMLGPLATERGLGYDHISGAITAVEAIKAGVELLTVITRAEHIGLPNIEDLREAIVGYRIAIELAMQTEVPDNPDTTFTCGLGFEGLSADQFFDLDHAVALKREKNNGDLRACSICNELCRMRIGHQRLLHDQQNT